MADIEQREMTSRMRASLKREAKAMFRLSQLWRSLSKVVEAANTPLSDHPWVCIGCETEDNNHHGGGCPIIEAKALLAELADGAISGSLKQ